MKVLINKEKALEINIKVQEALPEAHTRYLLELYKRLGGKYLTLSSDAHTVDKYYEGFDKYLKLIKRSGFASLTYFIKRNKRTF